MHAKPQQPRPQPVNTCVEDDRPRAKPGGRKRCQPADQKELIRSNAVWKPGGGSTYTPARPRVLIPTSHIVDAHPISFRDNRPFFPHCHQPPIRAANKHQDGTANYADYADYNQTLSPRSHSCQMNPRNLRNPRFQVFSSIATETTEDIESSLSAFSRADPSFQPRAFVVTNIVC